MKCTHVMICCCSFLSWNRLRTVQKVLTNSNSVLNFCTKSVFDMQLINYLQWVIFSFERLESHSKAMIHLRFQLWAQLKPGHLLAEAAKDGAGSSHVTAQDLTLWSTLAALWQTMCPECKEHQCSTEQALVQQHMLALGTRVNVDIRTLPEWIRYLLL